MRDEDRYLFDLQGFLVLPEALTPHAVRLLNDHLDALWAAEVEPDATTHRFLPLLGRGRAFADLIDNEPVGDLLGDLLGEQYRLDHEYADVIRRGLGPIGARLHGGAVPFRPAEFYWSDGNGIHSGLVAVAYNLTDVDPATGGFACVPGSHKSAFAFPDDWKSLEDPHPCVRRIGGPAGTAIVFTEALVHGTLPWTAGHERRTVFYKYSPAPISWDDRYYDPDAYPDLTERQRAMLRRPSVKLRMPRRVQETLPARSR